MKNLAKLAAQSLGVNMPNANITTWMLLAGKQYQLKNFKISFAQTIGTDGKPQSEVRGGKIAVTLSETVGPEMYRWIMSSGIKLSGEIRFKVEGANAPMIIAFNNAYCLNFDRLVDSVGGGCETLLVISPEEVIINGIDYNNFW